MARPTGRLSIRRRSPWCAIEIDGQNDNVVYEVGPSTLGPVNVVLSNNGAVSQSFSVTLQAVAAGIFHVPRDRDVVATTLNYTLVGDPSVVSGAAPAHPGDLVVLWGTGFGATTPSAASGTMVIGGPATTAQPAMIVAGVAAQVISSVLTAGEAGLYQITIRIPNGIPSSEDTVTASIEMSRGHVLFCGHREAWSGRKRARVATIVTPVRGALPGSSEKAEPCRWNEGGRPFAS
jgi:uncharacterized protein (TIGR03437 family)